MQCFQRMTQHVNLTSLVFHHLFNSPHLFSAFVIKCKPKQFHEEMQVKPLCFIKSSILNSSSYAWVLEVPAQYLRCSMLFLKSVEATLPVCRVVVTNYSTMLHEGATVAFTFSFFFTLWYLSSSAGSFFLVVLSPSHSFLLVFTQLLLLLHVQLVTYYQFCQSVPQDLSLIIFHLIIDH